MAAAPPQCIGNFLDDAELALLEVVLEDRGRIQLEEIVTSYSTDSGFYLPLGTLAEALQFPIQVNDAVTHAHGWFLESRRSFRFDLSACEVSIGGRTQVVDSARVAQMDDDIYVHESLLETWFPIALSIDKSTLRLIVTATEPLPIQRQRERRSQWERIRQRSDVVRENHNVQRDPYRFMDWPFLDATAQWETRRLESGERVDTDRYKVVAAGDFLFMNALASAQATNGEVQDVFVTLSRRDPYRELLGPLHASEFAIGDIATARDPLVASNVLGRGLHLSNRPLNRPLEFDRFNLQGELPLGWDVELYRNGQLMAFQSGSVGSRYDFVDIPLEFGVNNFRLVFYGPNGEVREETLQRVIGQDMIRSGEHQYMLTAMEERGLQSRTFAGEPEAATSEERIFFGYDYGVTRALSIGLGGRRLPLDSVLQDYHSAHVNLAVPYLFTRLEYVDQVDGGDAYTAQLSTRLLGLDVAAETSAFNSFDSERVRLEPVPGDLLERNELRLGARLPSFPRTSLAFATELRQFIGTDGERYEAFNRMSLSGRYGTVTHIYEMDRTSATGIEIDRARQRLLFSTHRGWAAFRGEVVEELEPERYVHSVGVSADWPIGERALARLSATRLPLERVNTYSAGLNWRFDYFSFGMSVGTTSTGETTAGLVLSSSFIRDPGGRDWQLSSNTRTHSGAIGVDVFLDENGNGVRDFGELPVPEAEIKTNGIARDDAKANVDGYVFIPGLPAYQPVDVSVDSSSLYNPFWKVDDMNVALVPRPGRTVTIELPVTPTGSIEGGVVVPPGADPRLAEGQRIHLLTADGEPVQETLSAHDGYYYFEGIRPGFYRIRIANSGIERPYDPNDLLIEIHGGMEIIQSADLLLRAPVVQRQTRRSALGGERASAAASESISLPTVSRAESDARSGGYTIQLMAASEERLVQTYIRRHGLEQEAGYTHTARHGQPWYQVLFSQYQTADAARTAIRQLPRELKAAGPYIRPLISVGTPLQYVQTPVSPERATGAIPAQVRGEAWLRSRPSGNFTLQLAAFRTERDAIAYIQANRLESAAAYFRATRNGSDWYSVVYGDFSTRAGAEQAASALPSSLASSDFWVRRFVSIQQILER